MKRILITEKQQNMLIRRIVNEENTFGREQILMIKKYLDEHFLRAKMNQLDNNGMPTKEEIVVLVDGNKNPLKYMTDKEAFYMLQEEFKNICQDKEKRDEIIKNVLKQWYKKEKLLDDGTLSK
jgi:hypothetical protein